MGKSFFEVCEYGSGRVAGDGRAVKPQVRDGLTERNEVLFRRRLASGEEYRWLALYELDNERGLPHASTPVHYRHLEGVTSVKPLQRRQLPLSSYEHCCPFSHFV